MTDNERENQYGSYMASMQNIMNEFNQIAKGDFIVESRVLIPSAGFYSMDVRGIIIEYTGAKEHFEDTYHKYESELYNLAHKLDRRTSIYEYSFESEFCNIDKWVEYEGNMVAYNYEL